MCRFNIIYMSLFTSSRNDIVNVHNHIKQMSIGKYVYIVLRVQRNRSLLVEKSVHFQATLCSSLSELDYGKVFGSLGMKASNKCNISRHQHLIVCMEYFQIL